MPDTKTSVFLPVLCTGFALVLSLLTGPARSASDAKGPVSMFLAAIDAMQAAGFTPNFNMKVIMDFEEELGSPNLPQAVRDNRNTLAADMLIIFDGPDTSPIARR